MRALAPIAHPPPRLLPPTYLCAQAAGLASALSDPAFKGTVFAPTDAAFAAALEALNLSAAEALAQPELLQQVRKLPVCGVGGAWGVRKSQHPSPPCIPLHLSHSLPPLLPPVSLPLLQILQYHVVPQQALTASELYDGLVLNTLLPPNVSTPAATTGLMHMQKPTVVKHQLTILSIKVRRGTLPPPGRGSEGLCCSHLQESPHTPTHRLHCAPPPPPPSFSLSQVISHVGVSHRITVEGEESSAKVVAADINAGCPAVVHVVDGVLLPNLS